MASRKEFWETLYQRFDPLQPVQEHVEWRAERPNSPRKDIIEGLNFTFASGKRYLMLGTVGTGKTTELLAIAESQRDRLVVFFDVAHHFQEQLGDPNALDHVQAWEILLLIGVAVYKSAKDAFGVAWAAENLEPFERAIQAFSIVDDAGAEPSASIDLAKLASSLIVLAAGSTSGIVATGLRVVQGVTASSRWTLPLGRRNGPRLSDQNTKVRDLLDATNLLIGTIQLKHQPLVLIIDGLDRIREPATTRHLFTESALFANLVCATVITGPLVLRRQGLVGLIRHFDPKVLANVPVLDHETPASHGPGIAFMREVYERRIRDTERPAAGAGIPEPLLDRLAYYSGGEMRSFIRFIRMAAERAWPRDVDVVDESLIESCIDERRRVMEMGLNRKEIDVLTQVARDSEHLLPADEIVESLLDKHCLLPYPNESEWYYPHPLLTLRMVKTG